jgi:hypothetical protein
VILQNADRFTEHRSADVVSIEEVGFAPNDRPNRPSGIGDRRFDGGGQLLSHLGRCPSFATTVTLMIKGEPSAGHGTRLRRP